MPEPGSVTARSTLANTPFADAFAGGSSPARPSPAEVAGELGDQRTVARSGRVARHGRTGPREHRRHRRLRSRRPGANRGGRSARGAEAGDGERDARPGHGAWPSTTSSTPQRAITERATRRVRSEATAAGHHRSSTPREEPAALSALHHRSVGTAPTPQGRLEQ